MKLRWQSYWASYKVNCTCHWALRLEKAFLKAECGKLAAFWMSYNDMVALMLRLIRGSHEGNWNLHMEAIRTPIPRCYAYDHLNYAHYLPVFYSPMSRLPVEHPGIFIAFQQGRFSAQLTWNHASIFLDRFPWTTQLRKLSIRTQKHQDGGIHGFSTNF